MVRVNLIEPAYLADQHLIAEYREILLLFGYYKKNNKHEIKNSENNLMHPIQFYDDKRLFLLQRFIDLKKEMTERGFSPQKIVKFEWWHVGKNNNWIPQQIHIDRIKERITQRLNEKPGWYRYCGEYQPPEFFEELMKNGF